MFELTPGRGGAPVARRLDMPLEEALASAHSASSASRCCAAAAVTRSRPSASSGTTARRVLRQPRPRAVAYGANYVANGLLEEHGIEVLRMPTGGCCPRPRRPRASALQRLLSNRSRSFRNGITSPGIFVQNSKLPLKFLPGCCDIISIAHPCLLIASSLRMMIFDCCGRSPAVSIM